MSPISVLPKENILVQHICSEYAPISFATYEVKPSKEECVFSSSQGDRGGYGPDLRQLKTFEPLGTHSKLQGVGSTVGLQKKAQTRYCNM